jgi:hypothetical protein
MGSQIKSLGMEKEKKKKEKRKRKKEVQPSQPTPTSLAHHRRRPKLNRELLYPISKLLPNVAPFNPSPCSIS